MVGATGRVGQDVTGSRRTRSIPSPTRSSATTYGEFIYYGSYHFHMSGVSDVQVK
jgi:hypothetical protein